LGLAPAFILGLLTLTGSSFLAMGIAAPDSPFGAWSPLAWVHDARAAGRMDTARPGPADLNSAEAESWAALSHAPVDDVAWLDLASIDRLRHGRLTARGLLWLQRSYDVAPFGPDTSRWRVRFALDNWDSLTPELREEVAGEFKAEWSHAQADLQAMGAGLQSRNGRLAWRVLLLMNRAPTGLRSPSVPSMPR
jgi:hypothetical protein